MALAFLCSKLRAQDSGFRIADHPVSSFRGVIIDHGLRNGSAEEAEAVTRALRALDPAVQAQVYSLNWNRVLGDHRHPKELPNVESVARRLRYDKIGRVCAFFKMASLLVAHHEDDQYETVFMRLLQGHPARGLRGMKKASGIPECEGIFGAYQSGYVNDQKRETPLYNNNVGKDELRDLRRLLRNDIEHQKAQDDDVAHDAELRESGDLGEVVPIAPLESVEMQNIDVEDGGTVVYRPLLEFSKDRLIATCLENNVPWWEDQTNQDATLTLRNAVRHLYKGHDLPKALQKPAILDFARKCADRAQAQEAAAERLLRRAVVKDFQPNVGTVIVRFPTLVPQLPRRRPASPERRQALLIRQRGIVGVLIQKILALVSPAPTLPPLASLQNAIARLFPSLASPAEAALAHPAKAFVIAGVHFIPLGSDAARSTSSTSPGQPMTWYLSRAPYPANLPVPWYRTPYWSLVQQDEESPSPAPGGGSGSGAEAEAYAKNLERYTWSKWMQWHLWDNRYWIRVMHRLPYRVAVRPYGREHAAAFRAQLAPPERTRLEALLARYAPAKTRYTLPALYLEEDFNLADAHARPRTNYPVPPGAGPDGSEKNAGSTTSRDADLNLDMYQDQDQDQTTPTTTTTTAEDHTATTGKTKTKAKTKMKLLALPSLEVRIPRLRDWLRYEIRYRRVDRATLEAAAAAAVDAGFRRREPPFVTRPRKPSAHRGCGHGSVDGGCEGRRRRRKRDDRGVPVWFRLRHGYRHRHVRV